MLRFLRKKNAKESVSESAPGLEGAREGEVEHENGDTVKGLGAEGESEASMDTAPEPVPHTAERVGTESDLLEDDQSESTSEPEIEATGAPGAAASPDQKRGFFGRLRNALAKTGSGLVGGITGLFGGGKVLDEDLLEEVETLLLSADLGLDATDRILEGLGQRLKRNELGDAAAALAALKQEMLGILAPVAVPLVAEKSEPGPFVILTVGVNGAGKTTTIGKLAQRHRQAGKSVMLAAGDTFRAAAVEQLQEWGRRLDVPVVAQGPGADSASVAFDALQSATARQSDLLIVDTAGRLHTQTGLMDELKKVRRVLGKLDPDTPHETLLVLDAGTGQNALVQAEQFQNAVEVSGIVLTKLDGTAKGGVIFSIAHRLGIPIRFIGVGEQADDLREFDSAEFVDALLSTEHQTPGG